MEDMIGGVVSEAERWAKVEIEGVADHYEVSDEGRVRNVNTGKVLTQTRVFVRRNGKEYSYDSVSLRGVDGGAWWKLKVHRLVAEAFVANPDGKSDVSRLVEGSNRARDLVWQTRSEITTGVERPPSSQKGDLHWKRGTKVSEATRARMSKAKMGKKNPNVKGTYVCEGKLFDTADMAAKHFKISSSTVLRRIQSDNKEWAAWYIKGQMKINK